MSLDLGELRVKIGADISELRRGLTEAKAEIQGLQDALKATQSASAGISAAAQPMQEIEQTTARTAGNFRLWTAYFIGRQIFDGFKEMMDAAADFNDQIARVATTANLTKQQMNELSASTLALAGKTGIGPKDLAEGMFLVSEASKDASENVAMLTTIAQAARVGLTPMKETTDFLLDFATAFGDATEAGVKHAADMAIVAQSLGRLPFREQAVRLGPQSASAAEAGLKPEEFYAMATGATQAGLQPNQIGQAQQAMFRAFLKPNAEMSEALATVATGLAAEGKLQGPDVENMLLHQGQLEALRKQLDTVKPGKETSDVVQRMKDERKAIEESAGALGPAIIRTLGFRDTLKALQDTVGGNVTSLEKMFQRTTSVTLIQHLTGQGVGKYTEDLHKFENSLGEFDRKVAENMDHLNAAAQNFAKFKATFAAGAVAVGQGFIENVFATPEKFPGRAQPKMQFDLIRSAIDAFRNFHPGNTPELNEFRAAQEAVAFRKSEISGYPMSPEQIRRNLRDYTIGRYFAPAPDVVETSDISLGSDRKKRRGGLPPFGPGAITVGAAIASSEDIAAQGLGFDTLKQIWNKLRTEYKGVQDAMSNKTLQSWMEMKTSAITSSELINVNVVKSSMDAARGVSGAFAAMESDLTGSLGTMQATADATKIHVPVQLDTSTFTIAVGLKDEATADMEKLRDTVLTVRKAIADLSIVATLKDEATAGVEQLRDTVTKAWLDIKTATDMQWGVTGIPESVRFGIVRLATTVWAGLFDPNTGAVHSVATAMQDMKKLTAPGISIAVKLAADWKTLTTSLTNGITDLQKAVKPILIQQILVPPGGAGVGAAGAGAGAGLQGDVGTQSPSDGSVVPGDDIHLQPAGPDVIWPPPIPIQPAIKRITPTPLPQPQGPWPATGPRQWRRFATGGIVTSPTLGLVGEAGPEAVLPLSRGIGGTTVNIQAGAIVVNGAKDPAAVAQEIVWLLKRKGIRLA